MHTSNLLPTLLMAAFMVLNGTTFTYASAESSTRGSGVAKEVNRPNIAGFRSARFGMSEQETLEAMQRDFQLQRGEIEIQHNDEDRTSSLVATVTDIFPGSEAAQVVYIHGYKQKKLIQINVLWGLPVTEEPDSQELVTTANVLRKYFGQLGFAPENTVMNTRVDDNIFLVFRATDEQERMVLLQLISRQAPAIEEGENSEPSSQVVSLWLSYIEDVENPDVFQIQEGTF